jgi:hypothetical protein
VKNAERSGRVGLGVQLGIAESCDEGLNRGGVVETAESACGSGADIGLWILQGFESGFKDAGVMELGAKPKSRGERSPV